MLHFGPSLFVTQAKWPLVNCTSLNSTKQEACGVYCAFCGGVAKFGFPDLPSLTKNPSCDTKTTITCGLCFLNKVRYLCDHATRLLLSPTFFNIFSTQILKALMNFDTICPCAHFLLGRIYQLPVLKWKNGALDCSKQFTHLQWAFNSSGYLNGNFRTYIEQSLTENTNQGHVVRSFSLLKLIPYH